jgi:hypothetical protein
LRYFEPSGMSKTIHHFFHPICLVDLLAIVPFYLRTLAETTFPGFEETGILRVLRLLRIFRIAPFYMHMIVSTHGVVKSKDQPHLFRIFDFTWFFKFLSLGDFAQGAPLFFTTLRASWPAISIFFMMTLMFCVIMGGVLYNAEMGEYRVVTEGHESVGKYLLPVRHGVGEMPTAYTSMWQGIYFMITETTTATTMHYLQPTTPGGMFALVVIDYIALLFLCFPIAIIGRNFSDQYEQFFRGWDTDELWYSSDEDEGEEDEDEDNYAEESKQAGLYYEDDEFDKGMEKSPEPEDRALTPVQ